MKGSKEQKYYLNKYKNSLKKIRFDDLVVIIKFPNCKKWRKVKRRPRDGYGIRPE